MAVLTESLILVLDLGYSWSVLRRVLPQVLQGGQSLSLISRFGLASHVSRQLPAELARRNKFPPCFPIISASVILSDIACLHRLLPQAIIAQLPQSPFAACCEAAPASVVGAMLVFPSSPLQVLLLPQRYCGRIPGESCPLCVVLVFSYLDFDLLMLLQCPCSRLVLSA